MTDEESDGSYWVSGISGTENRSKPRPRPPLRRTDAGTTNGERPGSCGARSRAARCTQNGVDLDYDPTHIPSIRVGKESRVRTSAGWPRSVPVAWIAVSCPRRNRTKPCHRSLPAFVCHHVTQSKRCDLDAVGAARGCCSSHRGAAAKRAAAVPVGAVIAPRSCYQKRMQCVHGPREAHYQ